MREALERVKRELGPEAVILGTRTVRAGGLGPLAGRQRVEITAAPAGASSPAPRLKARQPFPVPAREKAGDGTRAWPNPLPAFSVHGEGTAQQPPQARPQLPQPLYPYYVQLVQNEVAEDLAAQLVRRAALRVPADGQDDAGAVRAALHDCIAQMLPEGAGSDPSGPQPRRVAFVGPSGAGKTTTVAKLAAQFKLRAGRSLAVLSLDTHRPGATEQLRRYVEALELPLYIAQTVAEVKHCLKAADSADVLLIDTPGVGLREQGRFARLAALLRAARPDETHLVLPASLADSIQLRVAQSFAPLGISRAVLTRLDEVIGFGVILNAAQRLNLKVSYVTTGQNVPQDIEAAGGRRVAELLGLASAG